MRPSLDGVQIKLQRATDQIEFLKGEMAAFIEADAYTPVVNLRRARGDTRAPFVFHYEIRARVNRECPPVWSAIVGEILYNIRSALDQFIYQAVIFSTDRPPISNKTQFPIFLNAAGFASRGMQQVVGVSKAIVALINNAQPFVTGEDTQSPLWHLNELCNFDKHRALHLTGGTIEAYNYRFPPFATFVDVIDKYVMQSGAFKHNAILASGTMLSPEPPFGFSEVKVNTVFSFNIVFDEKTPLVGEWKVLVTLLGTLNRSRQCLRHIAQQGMFMDLF